MRIAVASDHAGFKLKETVKLFLIEAGHEVKDFGTNSAEASVDYPDFGYPTAKAVADGIYDRGVLICGTGTGMCIVANKVRGVRAALCHDVLSANFSRSHNDSNILAMGERITTPLFALEILKVWLSTSFSGGRHEARVEKIKDIEEKEFK